VDPSSRKPTLQLNVGSIVSFWILGFSRFFKNKKLFTALVRQGGILNIRTKFVNDLATYQLARATKRAFDDEANADFNRYPDVTLHDHTRVVLKNGPDGSDYVHASHVKGAEFPMICAQGPVENSIDNFWTLVVEQNCGVSLRN